MDQENMLDEFLPDENAAPKRPVAITIVCVAFFFFILILIPAVQLRYLIKNLGWGSAFIIGLLALMLVFNIGLWKMKKWGAYGFLVIFLISQITSLVKGNWSSSAFIIPFITAGIILFHLKKMTN